MAESPSSSAREARRALATRLRELRLDAGHTARALSLAAGWHESKTSRIESAQQGLTDADIHTWCGCAGPPISRTTSSRPPGPWTSPTWTGDGSTGPVCGAHRKPVSLCSSGHGTCGCIPRR
ncbi:helix-turn-helix domain-containing protein [Nocardiopsis sp. NPDC006938]|uniref:helix-turn-helix domain-containing protein n=1 Tax=Nocardiopsis sp. NPDC006938 TaxID=3364337 RepID=UPI003696FB9B